MAGVIPPQQQQEVKTPQIVVKIVDSKEVPACGSAAETLNLIAALQQQLIREHGEECARLKAEKRKEYLRNYSKKYYQENRDALLEKAKQKYRSRRAQLAEQE